MCSSNPRIAPLARKHRFRAFNEKNVLTKTSICACRKAREARPASRYMASPCALSDYAPIVMLCAKRVAAVVSSLWTHSIYCVRRVRVSASLYKTKEGLASACHLPPNRWLLALKSHFNAAAGATQPHVLCVRAKHLTSYQRSRRADPPSTSNGHLAQAKT